MSEVITLVGGPCDGVSMPWTGGDEVRHFAPPGKYEVTYVLQREGLVPVRDEPALYRRSLKTRNIFVYQP